MTASSYGSSGAILALVKFGIFDCGRRQEPSKERRDFHDEGIEIRVKLSVPEDVAECGRIFPRQML
jgi:hypothetical protein